MSQDKQDDEVSQVIKKEEDDFFRNIFVNHQPKDHYDDFTQINDRITHYEVVSNCQLKIIRSDKKKESRVYTCATHQNCSFKCSFGRRLHDHKLVLKNYNIYHSGP